MFHSDETVKNELSNNFVPEEGLDSFQCLLKLEARQGYVTDKDVLKLFPDTGQDEDLLSEVNLFLQSEGVLYVEEQDRATNTGSDPFNNMKLSGKGNGNGESEDEIPVNFDLGDLIGIYFYEAARRPLLTLDEEVALSKRIERGFLAREEILNFKGISTRRFQELLTLIEDSQDATNVLITANSRLVISIAKRHTNRGVPFLDLIQEGNIGLMRAAKRFDYKRGFKFSTYATWWIRQAVTRAVADQSRTIRLPVHINDQLFKIYRMQHKLRQQLGREPEISELAEHLGLPGEKIREMLKVARFPLSLDMPTQDDSDRVLGDSIEDLESPDPDEEATHSMLRQHLEQLLTLIPAREVMVLKLRFGLSGEKEHSLQEIGQKIGVSRERIRQIEAKAISRLQRPEINRQLRSYLNQHPT